MNELLIFGDIGFEVQASQVVADLAPMEGDVLVRVNSYGGDIYEGISIMHALRSHPGQVTVRVEGVAASAASIIAVGGADRTEMTAGSEMMIHLPWISAPGNSDDLRKAADDLERTARSMADLYAEKAGGGPQVWLEMMRAETWFSAQEAVDAGLANAVVDARAGKSPVLAGASRKRFAFAGRSEAPTPKILKEDNDVAFMSEVAKRLGMADADLNEDSVLAALDETLAEQAEEPTTETEQDEVDEAGESLAETQRVVNEKVTDEDDADDDQETGTADEDPAPASDEGTGDSGEDDAPAEDSDASEVVTLNKAVYEDLLERAGRVDEHDRVELAQRAAALIDTDGIKAGRLLGWQRDAWVDRAVENYDATRAALLALSPGTVNVTERGVAGSADDAGKQSKSQHRGRDAGLAPAPTV